MRDELLIKIAEADGNDADLILLDQITALKDELDSLPNTAQQVEEAATRVAENMHILQKGDSGERGIDGYTPIKGVDYSDGRDARNPLLVSPRAPLNPQIGDLWYQP